MLPTTPQTQQAQWLPEGYVTKAAAAATLKVTIDRLPGIVRERKLQTLKVRNPEINQVVTVIHKGAVERELWRREHEAVVPVATLANPNKPVQAALPAPEADDPEMEDDDEPPPSPWPWLTLDQAARYSKLTKRWLLWEAEQSVMIPEAPRVIATRDMGKHAPGGRWRFHRESLERA